MRYELHLLLNLVVIAVTASETRSYTEAETITSSATVQAINVPNNSVVGEPLGRELRGVVEALRPSPQSTHLRVLCLTFCNCCTNFYQLQLSLWPTSI